MKKHNIALLLSVIAAVIFWVAESLIHYYTFHDANMLVAFLPHEANEAWMRSFIICLFLTMGLMASRLLRKQEEQIQQLTIAHTVYQTINEGVVVTDSQNNIITANDAFTNITGHALEDVVGKNPNLLQSGKQDKTFYENMWHELKNNGSWQGEVWNRRKSGELYPEWLSIVLVKDEEGEIANHIGVISDITQRKQIEEKIQYYAFHDPLTNLPNRQLFADRLKQALKSSERYKNNLGLLYCDLDKFKPINDEHGHAVGDLLLQKVADLLKTNMRDTDTVARFGGDEFVIFADHMPSKEHAMQFANHLTALFAQPIIVGDGIVCDVTISIGVALYPEHADDMYKLIHCADQAMYQAKELGHNQAVLYKKET